MHSLTQHQRLQLILDPRPPLHLLVPMHQQLPHIPLLQRRHPDPRKPVFSQQLQHQLRVPPVRLLLSHFHRPDPRRIPNPQLDAPLPQQPLEPGIMPAGLHSHPHPRPAQPTVKLLRLFAVLQSPLRYFSRLIVKDRDLLKPRMKITAYNQHDVGSFSSLGRLRSSNLLRDRANVVMQSSEDWSFAKRTAMPSKNQLHDAPDSGFQARRSG
jgi:hypothetical protein